MSTKDKLNWLTINPDTLPKALQEKHKVIRGLFAQLKTAKAAFEGECDKVLTEIAPALPDDAKRVLQVGTDGKFPANTVRKFSYMYGIGVATAPAGKVKASSGLSLSK